MKKIIFLSALLFLSFEWLSANSLTINITTMDMVMCNGQSTGKISVNATGGDGSYTFIWSNGMSGSSISNLAANTYQVTVTDGTNCSGTQTVTLTEPPVILTGIANLTNASCNSNADGSATISVTGGNGGYSFSWPDGTENISNNSLIAGNYDVTVSDQNGCSTVQSLSISENLPISTGFLNFSNTTCFGGSDGSATASAAAGSGNYSYEWSNGVFGVTATGLSAGFNYVTITDQVNCSAVDSIEILEPMSIQVDVNGIQNESTSGANDGWISVNVWGGTEPYTYEWQLNGTTVSTNQDPAGLASGDYVLNVSDSNNCTFSSTTITVDIGVNTQEVAFAKYIQLSPNPTAGKVNLSLQLPQNEQMTVEVFNMIGQDFYRQIHATQTGNIVLDMQSNPDGIYFVRFTIENQSFTKRFVLKK